MINPKLARRIQEELHLEEEIRAMMRSPHNAHNNATSSELAERLVVHRDNVSALVDQVRHEAGITPQHIEELVNGP